jgi:hypothetical protein
MYIQLPLQCKSATRIKGQGCHIRRYDAPCIMIQPGVAKPTNRIIMFANPTSFQVKIHKCLKKKKESVSKRIYTSKMVSQHAQD